MPTYEQLLSDDPAWPEFEAAANGLAFAGLGLALGTAALARAWFSPRCLPPPPEGR